jgi:hypothetical protein
MTTHADELLKVHESKNVPREDRQMSSDVSACKNPACLRSIKQRYKTQSGYGRKESWRKNSGNLFGAFLIPIWCSISTEHPTNPTTTTKEPMI